MTFLLVWADFLKSRAGLLGFFLFHHFLNDLLDSQGIYCHSGHETNVEELVQ